MAEIRSIKTKMKLLHDRAAEIKKDPNLRHVPNEHDIKKVSENTHIMQESQFNSINSEVRT